MFTKRHGKESEKQGPGISQVFCLLARLVVNGTRNWGKDQRAMRERSGNGHIWLEHVGLEVPWDVQVGLSLFQGEGFMSGSLIAFGEQAFPKLLFFTSFPSVISPTLVTFSASAPLRKVTLNPCLLPRALSLSTHLCLLTAPLPPGTHCV